MKAIDPQFVKDTATRLKISKSLQRQLNLSVLADMSESHWEQYELFGLSTKNSSAGILFLEPRDDLYAIAYEINAIPAGTSGRTKPIICDFCKTWQTGGRAGSITFRTERRSSNSVSFLCCLDLACSLHVRDLTPASKSSRAQLREDITPGHRVERLQAKLVSLIEKFGLEPLQPKVS